MNMNPDQLNGSRETGKKVWESLQAQMAEGSGFLSAMFRSFRLFVQKEYPVISSVWLDCRGTLSRCLVPEAQTV